MFNTYAAARVVAGVVSLVLAGSPGTAVAQPSDPNWGGADLSVRMRVSPGRAQPGQPLSYRVKVHNAGPGEAVLPVLTVRIPAGVAILGTDVAECVPGAAGGEVVCASRSDVPPGGSGAVTITGMVRPTARGPLVAVATVSSEVVDDNVANDSARTLTPVDEGADLAIRSAGRFRTGRTVTMAAVVRNRGPRTVRDALVFFQARRARFLAARGARCRPRPGYVGCRLRAVAPGGRVRLDLDFSSTGQPVRAKASVHSARVGDRRPGNNVARMRVR
ncbi:DUF11 domain-containing protein [Planobispora siamensis]|uniref:DUF11 domain-containing protein n=1 Tax=Planobispora siamensis TaxID=936338 RepID=UPI00194FDAD4|nr:DUF11 domain-containing protein [Planobispora siamensis]